MVVALLFITQEVPTVHLSQPAVVVVVIVVVVVQMLPAVVE
jgi:hypothetical protein